MTTPAQQRRIMLQNVKVELKQVQLALDSVDWVERSTGRPPSAEELKSVTDRVNKVVQDVANVQAQAAMPMPPSAAKPQLPPSMPLASPWQMQMQMGNFRPGGAMGLPGMHMGGMLGMGGLSGGLPGMPPGGGGPMDLQATVAALNNPLNQGAQQTEEEASAVPGAGGFAAFDMEAVRRLAQQAEEEEDRQEQEEEEARELEKQRAADAVRVQAEIEAKVKVDHERYEQMRHQQQAAAASAAARQIEQSRARQDGRKGDDSGDDMDVEDAPGGSTQGGFLPPQNFLPPLPGQRAPMQPLAGLQVAPPGHPPLPPPTPQTHWNDMLANRAVGMPGADGMGHVPKAVPPPGPWAFRGGFAIAPPSAAASSSSSGAAAIAAQLAGDLSSTLAGQLASSAALKAQGLQKKQVSVADAFNMDAEDAASGGLAGAMAAAAKKQAALPVGGLAAAAANMGFGSAQVEKRSRSRSRRNRRPSPVPVQRKSSNFDIGPGGAPLPGLEAPAPRKPAAKSRSKDRDRKKDKDRDRDRDRKKHKSRSRSRSRDRRRRDRSSSRRRHGSPNRGGRPPQNYGHGGRPPQSEFWQPPMASRSSQNETAIEITGGIAEHTSRLGLKRTMQTFGAVAVCHMGNRAVDLPFVRYETMAACESALAALANNAVFLDGVVLKGVRKGTGPPRPKGQPALM